MKIPGIKPGLIPMDEKDFTKLMKSKKKPSLLKAMPMREHRSLMYYTGKKLKQAGKTKELKKFKTDMLGLVDISYLNKHL